MFPNVRLMIAAIIVSVVVLTCGFGIFAAFRVNHEPLARLQPGTSPLRLAADEAAKLAAGEPFDQRFGTSAAKNGGGTSASAYSAVEASSQQAMTKVSPPPAEEVAPASATGAPAELAPPAAGEAAEEATASVPSAEDIVPDSVVTVEKTPPDAAQPSGPAPALVPTIAAIEPPAEPDGPHAQMPFETAVAPASAVPAATGSDPDSAVKKTARPARKYRGHAAAVAATFNANPQNWSYLQPHFLTAPPPYPPPQPVIRRHRVASEKPASEKPVSQKPANSSSAVGGPLVSPAAQ